MDWDKLRTFYIVAKAGSFTHAGNTLNLSQSAVSRQISTLESSLDIILFHRHARGLVLTEEGELLYKAASDIFAKLSMIEGQLADSKELGTGPLRITTASFIGTTWLAPRLRQLNERHPGIQLTLLFDNRILNLSMREADAAIRLYKPEEPDVIGQHLTDIHFKICASEDYLAAHGAPKDTKDLKNHTLIGYPEDTTAPFENPNGLFQIAGIDPENTPRVIMMNSLYGIYEAVRNGAGIALLPDFLVDESRKITHILPKITRDPVSMYFIIPKDRAHSKRITIFRDFLLETIKNTGF